MAGGRVSVARKLEPQRRTLPFSGSQLASLDDALTLASRSTGLLFSVYLGDLGADTRARAEALHASSGLGREGVEDAVLIAVSPGQRVVELVTGTDARRRLSDRSAKLAVMSMVASFEVGDLAGGLTSGLRMLADQAGKAPAEK